MQYDDLPDFDAILKAQKAAAPALSEDDIIGAARERGKKDNEMYSMRDGMKKLAHVVATDPVFAHIPETARKIFQNIADGVYANMSPEEKEQMARDDLYAKMVFINNQRGLPNSKGKYPGQKDCVACQARGFTVGIRDGELIAHRCSCIPVRQEDDDGDSKGSARKRK